MTQKINKNFKNENHSAPPKKKYATNKTDVYRIDDMRFRYIRFKGLF